MNTVSSFISALTLFTLTACGTTSLEDSVPDASGQNGGEFEDESTIITRTSFVHGTSLQDVIPLLAASGADKAFVRLRYGDHESSVLLDVTDSLALESVQDREMQRLDAIMSEFDPGNPLEEPTWVSLGEDFDMIAEGASMITLWADIPGEVVIDSPMVSATTLREPREDSADQELVHRSVIDFNRDAYYAPAGGTSTIYRSGSLQKFWLDAGSEGALNHSRAGLEINTLVQSRSSAYCYRGGVASNMPDWYADTEAFDGGPWRNCSVGTVSASSLSTGKLYWTWHPFGWFNTSANPLIQIQYQPKKWCWWIQSKWQCNANRAWCMCNNYLQTQWLVQYSYNDAPGREVRWFKN